MAVQPAILTAEKTLGTRLVSPFLALWAAVVHRNPPKCQSVVTRRVQFLQCSDRNKPSPMAKTRSGSVKEKRGHLLSASRCCRRSKIKSNGMSEAASESRSSTTRRSRSLKREKSTHVASQRSPANRDEERSPKRPSGKKRNSSVQELSECPTNKKPKVDTSKAQIQEVAKMKDGDGKHCSLLGQGKKAEYSNVQSPNKRKDDEHRALQTSSVREKTLEKNQVKQKSPLKHKIMHEATPENLQCSPRKDKAVQEKLKLDMTESVGIKQFPVENDTGGSSSEESSGDEGVAWEDVDEAHVADHVLETSHKADHEASTSHQHHSPSKKSVEISITMPGAKQKKKGWSQEDIMKYIKRAINRFRKEVHTKVHKVHLLALVSHGIFRNSVCNEPLLQAVLLSHVPGDFISGNKRKWDISRLTNFLQWFQSEFSSIADVKTGEEETDKQIAKLQNLSEALVVILRALGLLTRLLYSMQPMSAKGDVEGKSSPNTSKKTILKGNKSTVKTTSRKISKSPAQAKNQKATVNKKDITAVKTTTSKSAVSRSENKIDSSKVNEGKVETHLKNESGELSKTKCVVKTPKRKGQVNKTSAGEVNNATRSSDNTLKRNKKQKKRPLRKRKKVDYSLCNSDDGSDADEEWNDQSSDSDSGDESEQNSESTANKSKKKGKTPLARKKVSAGSDSSSPSGSSSLSFVELMDDDSDFEVTSKPLVRRRVSAGSTEGKKKVLKIVSSDESDESMKCLGSISNEQDSNWWAEVYLPLDKKWICLHLESSSINHPELCEKQATQPLVYVVSFDNKNYIKDVTNRYASTWMSKTRKFRIDSDWWEDTLRPYKSKHKKMEEMEDSHLEDQLFDKPLPTSITEYKNHPLYVLKRHLLKFEAIYPETAAILGYCRGEAVYSRECLHTLHTREKWLNEALVVKPGEKAYKIVKGRPKRNQPIHERDSVTIDLFGRWQTEKYKPPPAKDGKVPRNEYGNVELFLPCMLPPGTKHIQINGIQRVAKKLGIDCAQAVVGFDFHCGFSHPVIDGVVVCEEFEQALLDAWREEEEQAAKRKAEKREKRMLANWKLLTRSLLIRERLKKRYDTEEPNMDETSTNGEDEAVTDTSISWPLNRQEGKTSTASDGHCHVFPTSSHKQDHLTGEWTKSCSCGLTLPFEKM